jgi:hypothetical protein
MPFAAFCGLLGVIDGFDHDLLKRASADLRPFYRDPCFSRRVKHQLRGVTADSILPNQSLHFRHGCRWLRLIAQPVAFEEHKIISEDGREQLIVGDFRLKLFTRRTPISAGEQRQDSPIIRRCLLFAYSMEVNQFANRTSGTGAVAAFGFGPDFTALPTVDFDPKAIESASNFPEIALTLPSTIATFPALEEKTPRFPTPIVPRGSPSSCTLYPRLSPTSTAPAINAKQIPQSMIIPRMMRKEATEPEDTSLRDYLLIFRPTEIFSAVLKLYPALRHHPVIKRVLHLTHFTHQIRQLHQLSRSVTTGDNDM